MYILVVNGFEFFPEQAKDIRCVNLVKCEETIGLNQFCFWVLDDTQCVSHHTAAIKMASMRAFLRAVCTL